MRTHDGRLLFILFHVRASILVQDSTRGDDGLDESDAEEAEEVDDGGDEGHHRGDLGQGDDVERGGGPDLLPPPVEEEVGHREEEREEGPVGQVEREGESIRGLDRAGIRAAAERGCAGPRGGRWQCSPAIFHGGQIRRGVGGRHRIGLEGEEGSFNLR